MTSYCKHTAGQNHRNGTFARPPTDRNTSRASNKGTFLLCPCNGTPTWSEELQSYTGIKLRYALHRPPALRGSSTQRRPFLELLPHSPPLKITPAEILRSLRLCSAHSLYLFHTLHRPRTRKDSRTPPCRNEAPQALSRDAPAASPRPRRAPLRPNPPSRLWSRRKPQEVHRAARKHCQK